MNHTHLAIGSAVVFFGVLGIIAYNDSVAGTPFFSAPTTLSYILLIGAVIAFIYSFIG